MLFFTYRAEENSFLLEKSHPTFQFLTANKFVAHKQYKKHLFLDIRGALSSLYLRYFRYPLASSLGIRLKSAYSKKLCRQRMGVGFMLELEAASGNSKRAKTALSLVQGANS